MLLGIGLSSLADEQFVRDGYSAKIIKRYDEIYGLHIRCLVNKQIYEYFSNHKTTLN